MARPPRDSEAGVFHVFTHCVWAAPAYFRDDQDRTVFLRELVRMTKRYECSCIGFALLGTHYHLMLEVGRGAMSRAMQSMNWRYAMQFNGRYDLRGHAQFARFGSRRIKDEPDLRSTYRYMARNPVRAGLSATPQEWPWSSYAGTVALAEAQTFVDPTLVISSFDGPTEVAIARLRAFVEES